MLSDQQSLLPPLLSAQLMDSWIHKLRVMTAILLRSGDSVDDARGLHSPSLSRKPE